ncbi:hypothetical protein FSP39_009786 [Pinctada imbricata]|uniref:Cytochrome P450 20A1 n=1 Tax=Pinctada imbricata TaxID=66713 RepID=A0AA89CDW4_PINIB|nr:hypothetical protein FSP39_009786 [Pinctada imbricata]
MGPIIGPKNGLEKSLPYNTVMSHITPLCLIYYCYGSSKPSSIPGPDPSTEQDGNLPDISRAGSLHEYLLDLHKTYGDIASFWMGRQFVVSICSPELFKEHQNVFDRPPELFKLFETFLGPKSIQYANKGDGRKRRNNYDKMLAHEKLKEYYHIFQNVADDLEKKWGQLVKEEHIPLGQYMSAFAIKVVLNTLFGEYFTTDKEILAFRRNYDICWSELERSLTDQPDPDSPRVKAFEDANKIITSLIKKAIEHRKKVPPNSDSELLIDSLIDNASDEEELLSDAITYAVGGFHTTGNVLTWGFYFLATHEDFQEKAVKEIKQVLGNENVDASNMSRLKYLHQILDETMRCAVVAPWAARFQDFDSELGGHKIPKNTPVIHALGVSLQNEKYFPLPNKFDPDRFNTENSKGRPSMAFQPFGFAGKRVCPGYRFAYAEAIVCLVTLLRKFKVKMVEGQVVTPVHGLVTHPEEEIWVKIQKR